MGYDEFITDGDKPYAENLNDSLLLLDAFNVTVPCEMPGMFNNGQFSSDVNVPRKCGVGIVTLKSVGSNITIGTTSISGSGEVVFRVYPNFNSFYKWQSIVLTKTGTVNIAFRKTDGTSISTSISSSGVIIEVADLKTLQEIDVVLTLSSATISKILISFVNNQSSRTRTGASLDANALINVNGSVAKNNQKAVNGGTVYTAVNNLSSNVTNSLSTKEDLSNKVTVLDDSETNYPSCSAVTAVTDTKANVSHTHDDRYFTESEINTKLNGKANTSHTHDDRYFTETEITTQLSGKVDKVSGKGLSANDYTTTEKNKLAGIATSANNYSHPSTHASTMIVETNALSNLGTNAFAKQSVINSAINTKMGQKAASSHTHDDRYYTETEVDTMLAAKAASSHTHDDRYYTESEINTKLNAKANTSHTHDDRYYTETEIDAKLSELLSRVYPVGSIYICLHNGNPGLVFGGTWAKIEGRFLLASSNAYSVNSTGGSADAVVVTHTHDQEPHSHDAYEGMFLTSVDDIKINSTNRSFPSASSNGVHFVYTDADTVHGISENTQTEEKWPDISSTGVSGTGKNMPPYLVVNVWRRTA